MSRSGAPLFDAIVRIDKLPASGRSVSVNADAATREAIAEAMNIRSVEQFEASLTITPFRGGLRAQGHLKARAVQDSVVSFEPVPQDISEPVDRIFLPADKNQPNPGPGSEVFVDLEDDEFPDHIDGPEVDLSELLLETLALALDPYPRLEGESLDSLGIKDDAGAGGPFADLARLKTRDGDRD